MYPSCGRALCIVFNHVGLCRTKSWVRFGAEVLATTLNPAPKTLVLQVKLQTHQFSLLCSRPPTAIRRAGLAAWLRWESAGVSAHGGIVSLACGIFASPQRRILPLPLLS